MRMTKAQNAPANSSRGNRFSNQVSFQSETFTQRPSTRMLGAACKESRQINLSKPRWEEIGFDQKRSAVRLSHVNFYASTLACAAAGASSPAAAVPRRCCRLGISIHARSRASCRGSRHKARPLQPRQRQRQRTGLAAGFVEGPVAGVARIDALIQSYSSKLQ